LILSGKNLITQKPPFFIRRFFSERFFWLAILLFQ
jgi:hypothetical protein